MVIYTSRYKCDIPGEPLQIIKINGFTEESINEYVTKTFENELNGKQMASELKEQLNKNLEIKKILHFPINVAIVCLVFSIFLNYQIHRQNFILCFVYVSCSETA